MDVLLPKEEPSPEETVGIERAIAAVEAARRQLEVEGFSRVSFFLGVVNVVVTSLVLVGAPAYFWLLYGIKCFVLIPSWLVVVTRIYNGVLFILDYCWVMSVCSGFYMLLTLLGAIPAGLRTSAFLAFFAASTGPLGWACLLLHNGVIFHSVEKTTSLFIHITPLLTCWTIRTYPEQLAATWPGAFPEPSELSNVTFAELYYHGFVVYFVWLVLYSTWLLTSGVGCPEKGRETVFNYLHKGGLHKVLRRITGSSSIRAHAATYLGLHCVAVALSFVWPPLCLHSWVAFTAFGAVLGLSAAWSGASYYEYILARKYHKVLEKMLPIETFGTPVGC